MRLKRPVWLPKRRYDSQEAGLRAKIKSIISESKATLVDEEEDEEDDEKSRNEILVTEVTSTSK